LVLKEKKSFWGANCVKIAKSQVTCRQYIFFLLPKMTESTATANLFQLKILTLSHQLQSLYEESVRQQRAETKTHLFIRVARFFLVQNTKMGKNLPKLYKNIPNAHKTCQMVGKLTKWI
jgi:hypothetical protein